MSKKATCTVPGGGLPQAGIFQAGGEFRVSFLFKKKRRREKARGEEDDGKGRMSRSGGKETCLMNMLSFAKPGTGGSSLGGQMVLIPVCPASTTG